VWDTHLAVSLDRQQALIEAPAKTIWVTSPSEAA
jgi:hypothetical protein